MKKMKKKIIKDISEIDDITIILVSHNLENFKFCNRIFELTNKNIKQLK